MDRTNHVDITMVLDRSGSMEGVREETIRSFNRFLSDQREEPGEAVLTLVQFDDEYEVVYDAAPLVDVPDLTAQRYVPRSSTALLDAMGQTIKRTDARLGDRRSQHAATKVLFVVITDGLENASREYDQRLVFDLIRERQRRGWQFVFLGANQDAIATASQYGIDRGGAMNVEGGTGGMRACFTALSAATRRHCRAEASAEVPAEADFFTEEERAATEPDRRASR